MTHLYWPVTGGDADFGRGKQEQSSQDRVVLCFASWFREDVDRTCLATSSTDLEKPCVMDSSRERLEHDPHDDRRRKCWLSDPRDFSRKQTSILITMNIVNKNTANE